MLAQASHLAVACEFYLHYVLDLRAKAWRRKGARGEMIVVRYADDAGGLELQPEKTRLIELGRYAAERRAKRGKGSRKPFTFGFHSHLWEESSDGRSPEDDR